LATQAPCCRPGTSFSTPDGLPPLPLFDRQPSFCVEPLLCLGLVCEGRGYLEEMHELGNKLVEQSEYRTPPCFDRTVDSKCCMASPLHAAATELRAFRDDAGGHKLSGVHSGLMHVDERSATYTGKVPVHPVHRKCTRQTREIGSQLLDSLSRTQLPGRPQAALETIYMEGAMTNSRLSPKCSNRNQPQSGPPALAQTPAQNPAPLSAAQDAHMRASSKPSRHA